LATQSDLAETWRPLGKLEPQFPKWLIPNLLPAESMICLYGKRGEGKTFLALDWACSLAAGKDWAGLAEGAGVPAVHGRVAYLLAERPEGIKRRALGWLKHQGLDDQAVETTRLLEGNQESFFLVAQRRYAIDDDKERLELIDQLKEISPSLVVLDPLVFFMDGKENDTRDMQRFADGLRQIIDERKCSILLVHHEGKGNVNNALGARGSSALEAAMDTVLHLGDVPKKALRDHSGKISKVSVTKQREAEERAPMYFSFVPVIDGEGRPLGKFPMIVELPAASEKEPSSQKKKTSEVSSQERQDNILLEIVKKIISRKELATRADIDPAFKKKTNLGSSTAYEILTRLVAENKLAMGKKVGRSNSYVLAAEDMPTPAIEAESTAP
jgi:hypothetical protein